jgi:hypothetical protein
MRFHDESPSDDDRHSDTHYTRGVLRGSMERSDEIVMPRHFQIPADSDIVRQFFSFDSVTKRKIAQRDLAKGMAWNDGPRLTPKKKR